jgi:RNA recognition motif-containing protein
MGINVFMKFSDSWKSDKPKEDPNIVPTKNLWVGNVGPDVTEEHIKNIFSPYGVIDKIRILRDKSCAFVDFVTAEAAK